MCGFCAAADVADPCGKDHLGSLEANIGSTEAGVIALVIPGNTSTTQTIAIGGTRDETLEVVDDQDWYRIELSAGDRIQIDLFGLDHDSGNGFGRLLDPYVRMRDASGTLLAENDDISLGIVRDSRLIYDVGTTGTYYIEVDSYLSNYTGDYRLQVSTPTPASPVDSVQTNFTLNTNDPVLVYFAEAGDTYAYNGDVYTAAGVNAYEQAQLFSVFEGVEAFLDIDFQITTNRNAADLEWATDTLPSGSGGTLLGFFFFPSSSGNGGYGVLNNNSSGFPSWNANPGGTLDTGGFMYGVAVHELGHGLGLGHTHDTGGGSEVMQGVSSSSDRGSFGLNSSPFTAMSYNEGWADSPSGLANSVASTGHGATFGAIDIAALQTMYGANNSHAAGDDVYELFDSNATGSAAGYYATWDTGGIDEFRYTGTKDAVIDLREASLQYNAGGGGYMSHVDGVIAGRTIAAGVTIENATGGSGDDTLRGNDASNRLVGNAGDDQLTGGAGADVFAFSFGDGFDTIADFGIGTDLIDLTGLGIGFHDLSITQIGTTATVRYDFATNGQISLTNTTATDLNIDTFLLDITGPPPTLFDEIWDRRISSELSPEVFSSSYVYGAESYFRLPLHHAYGTDGTEAQRGDFRDHFAAFQAQQFEADTGWLARGQYLSLVLDFITLEEHETAGATGLTAALADLLTEQVRTEWLESRDHDWASEDWTGRSEGIAAKLAAGENRITDSDMYVLALGSGLAARLAALGEAVPDWMQDAATMAGDVLEAFGQFDDAGHWFFPSGHLATHPDHRLSGWSGEESIAASTDGTDAAHWDSSHASRWPGWLTQIEAAEIALGQGSTAAADAAAGLGKTFSELVLHQDASGHWLTTNYIDGSDGVFRWGYQSFLSDNGYAASQLSGTFLLGDWSLLDIPEAAQASADLLALDGFGPELLERFNEPVRHSASEPVFDWRWILESEDIRLWLAMASGSTDIPETNRVAIDAQANHFTLAVGGTAELTGLLPDLSAFPDAMIEVVDMASRIGTDYTGGLSLNGTEIATGEVISVAVQDLESISYTSGASAAGDRLYWRIAPSDDILGGSAWYSVDLTRENTAPEPSLLQVSGQRNEIGSLADAITFFDPDGDFAGRLQVWHDGTDAKTGFRFGDTWLAGQQVYDFTADQVGSLSFVLDAAVNYQVRLSDGGVWSDWLVLDVDAINSGPTLVIDDVVRKDLGWVRFRDIVVDAADQEGDALVGYELWDETGSDSWWVNGSFVDATTGYSAAAGDDIWLRADSGASTQTLWARASDDQDPGEWASFTFETNAAPIVDVADVTLVTGEWLRLNEILGFSDREGDALQQIEVWDSQGSASWWADGGMVDAPTGYVTGNLQGTWLRGDTAASEQTLWVRAYDGNHWSDWQDFQLTTERNDPPVVTVVDQFLFAGTSVDLADIAVVSDANGDAITRYEVWDHTGAHSFSVDGAALDATRGAYLTDLDGAQVRADAAPGAQPLWIRAYDGAAWSEWDEFTMTTG